MQGIDRPRTLGQANTDRWLDDVGQQTERLQLGQRVLKKMAKLQMGTRFPVDPQVNRETFESMTDAAGALIGLMQERRGSPLTPHQKLRLHRQLKGLAQVDPHGIPNREASSKVADARKAVAERWKQETSP